VLGIDLVREQLRIAAGGGLPFAQSDVRARGHAFECRICAEEPEHGFRPAIGRVGVLCVPQGENVRFDAGIRTGMAVTPAFDSLLAKLIVWDATRAGAAAALERALTDLVILGVPTNIDYLARVVRHPQFLAGRLHTGFLSEHSAEIAATDASSEAVTAASIAAALVDRDFRRVAFGVPEPHASIGQWQN
jgi:acetyl/propionyl-CoA carboxylase alpha subunit